MSSVSIITVNYNDAAGLKRTLESMRAQSNQDFELLIIDGGSTDESVAVIEEHQDIVTYWVSESDRGIYHAMNKGIAKAQGDYVIFMNSGDRFNNDKSIELINRDQGNEDFIYFNINLKKEGSSVVHKPQKKLTFSVLRHRMPFHQATFIKRELFIKYGGYDEHLKIVSDWKFFILAIAKHHASYKYIDAVMSDHYHDGISADPANAPLIKKERNAVLQEHFSFFMEEFDALDKMKTKLKSLRSSRKIKALIKLGWINDF